MSEKINKTNTDDISNQADPEELSVASEAQHEELSGDPSDGIISEYKVSNFQIKEDGTIPPQAASLAYKKLRANSEARKEAGEESLLTRSAKALGATIREQTFFNSKDSLKEQSSTDKTREETQKILSDTKERLAKEQKELEDRQKAVASRKKPAEPMNPEGYGDIEDLINVGAGDVPTYHRPGKEFKDWKFLSNNELNQIQANQDLIKGIELEDPFGLVPIEPGSEDENHNFPLDLTGRAGSGGYKKPSERRTEIESRSRTEKEAKKTSETAEKQQLDQRIEETLKELKEKDYLCSKPVELLRKATKLEKKGAHRHALGITRRVLGNEEYVHYPELQSSTRRLGPVFKDGRPLIDRIDPADRMISRKKDPEDLFGHVAEGVTLGWAIPRRPTASEMTDEIRDRFSMGTGDSRVHRRRVNRAEGYYVNDLPDPDPRTSNSRIVTFDGNKVTVYERFAQRNDSQGNLSGFAVVEVEGRTLSQIPLKDLSVADRRIILDRLQNIN
jgi:hypothetical protein